MFSNEELEIYRKLWEKTKPETKGFHRGYKASTPEGDVLTAELSFQDRSVKISAEIARERGKVYSAVIKNGSIIRERDFTAGRNVPIRNKIYPFRYIFSCIPNDELLEIIGGAYDISKVSLGKPVYRERSSGSILPEIFLKRESFFEKLQKSRAEKRKIYGTPWQRFKRRFWGDLHDTVIGFSVGTAMYLHYFDYVVLGAVLASLGLLFGGFDWLLRNRQPLFSKILIFLCLGSYFFYTGYTKF